MADTKQNNSGRGWHGDPDGHASAGKKGGEKTSQTHDDSFYQQIGRKGGETISQDRKHMAEIGRKGGESRDGR